MMSPHNYSLKPRVIDWY